MPPTTLRLTTGDEMPAIGLGLWKVAPAVAARTIHDAITIG
jgi:diketogulonate reductase-like aldo/keto reductase